MNIAILSGKGGTGKTTVSTNLALALKANYIDCDVEEPNGFIFLKPTVEQQDEVVVEYPIINPERCITCGKCATACQFNALVSFPDEIMVMEKMCHSCGACALACPQTAIQFGKRRIGVVEKGRGQGISCGRGLLDISEPMAVPIIEELVSHLPEGINILDCPPGTSCNVVKSLKFANYALLVTEPTIFGLHDLKLAVELVEMMGIPCAVMINKGNEENHLIANYCHESGIPLLGQIPYCKEFARLYSQGECIYHHSQGKEFIDQLAMQAKEVLGWS